jgi:hypothetical protein
MYLWIVVGVYIVGHIDLAIMSNNGSDLSPCMRRTNGQRSISNTGSLTDGLAVRWSQLCMIVLNQIGWYFLSFQMLQYFLGHSIGSMYSFLHGFTDSLSRAGMAILSITPLFYIWLHIDMVEWLLGLLYDPWFQKHTLYTYTMDWEQTASSYLPNPFPHIICYDKYMEANMNHILTCTRCINESLGI